MHSKSISFPKKTIYIIFASCIFSLAIYLSKSNQLLTGGTPGVILIINHFFDSVSYGVLYASINIPLFLLSYFKYSKPFTIWSLIAVALISMTYQIVSHNITIHANPILISFISGLLQAISLRIYANNICSPGGLNIPASYFAEKTGTQLAYWLFGMDFTILSISLCIYGLSSWPTVITVCTVFVYLRLTK